MTPPQVAPYVALLTAFLERRLTVGEFETLYLFMFKNDPGGRGSETYEVLNALFGEVDAFCEDPELRAEASDAIGLEELQTAARLALTHLST